MSDKARAWCWEHSPFRGTKWIVHFAMADLANDMHDNRLWVGDKALAKKARTTTRTVIDVRTELISLAMLRVLSIHHPAPGRPLEYQLLMPETGEESSPELLLTGEESSRTGEDSSNAPLIKPKNQTAKFSAEDFDRRFWTLYPARGGKPIGKKATVALWAKLSPEEQDAVSRALPVYADWCRRQNRPTKDPERFISGRIWEDMNGSVPVAAEPEDENSWMDRSRYIP